MDAVILGFGRLRQYLWEGNLVLSINLPGPKDISQGIVWVLSNAGIISPALWYRCITDNRRGLTNFIHCFEVVSLICGELFQW